MCYINNTSIDYLYNCAFLYSFVSSFHNEIINGSNYIGICMLNFTEQDCDTKIT